MSDVETITLTPDTLTPEAVDSAYLFGAAHKATPLLIVYGSLRRGADSIRSTALTEMGATYEGPVDLRNAGLVSIYGGRFPTIERRDGATVNAEVWRVPERGWMRLDGIESHPHFYRREIVSVLDGGVDFAGLLSDAPTVIPAAEHIAWLYVMAPAHLEEIRGRGGAADFQGSDWVSAQYL